MKIELTQDRLDATVAALEDVLARYEQECAALLRVTAGHELAVKRLDQARRVAELVNFYSQL